MTDPYVLQSDLSNVRERLDRLEKAVRAMMPYIEAPECILPKGEKLQLAEKIEGILGATPEIYVARSGSRWVKEAGPRRPAEPYEAYLTPSGTVVPPGLCRDGSKRTAQTFAVRILRPADEPDPEPADEGLSAERLAVLRQAANEFWSGYTRDMLGDRLSEALDEINRLRAKLAERIAERDELRTRLFGTEHDRDAFEEQLAEVEHERDELRGRLEQIQAWAKELSRIDWRDLGPAANGICRIADGATPELGRTGGHR